MFSTSKIIVSYYFVNIPYNDLVVNYKKYGMLTNKKKEEQQQKKRKSKTKQKPQTDKQNPPQKKQQRQTQLSLSKEGGINYTRESALDIRYTKVC